LGCTPAPCLHGTCDDGGGAIYTCTCDPNWGGSDCDQSSDCDTNLCQNGGSCVDDTPGDGDSSCDCLPGFDGLLCENTDPCSDNLCLFGTCAPFGTDLYNCTCDDGYTGSLCDEDINECASAPCQNGASCTDGIDEFTCECDGDYTGVTCDTATDDCSPNPCQNGGSCADGTATYTCTCADGYSGDDCTVSTNGETCSDSAITVLIQAIADACDSCGTSDGLTDTCRASVCSGYNAVGAGDAACHLAIQALSPGCSDTSLDGYIQDESLTFTLDALRAQLAVCGNPSSSTGDAGGQTFVFKPSSAASVVPTLVSVVLALIVCLLL